MKYTSYRTLAVVGICGVLLIGCSSNESTDTDTSTIQSSEETQSSSSTSSESSSESNESIEASLHPEEADKDPIALENLELPEIYENTVIYNGTINPETTLRVIFPNEESPYPDVHGSDLTETGSFSITTNDQELKAGDKITFFVSGGGLGLEQDFYRTVQPAEEGKEIIKSSANTSEAEQEILNSTSLPDISSNTRHFTGETINSTEIYYTSEDGELKGETTSSSGGGGLTGKIDIYFNDVDLQVGQTIYFYIVSDGVIATIAKEVMDMTSEQEQAITKIQEETYLPEIYANTSTYYGKTLPNTKIMVANPYNSVTSLSVDSNENGDFPLPLDSFKEQINQMEVGDVLLFTFTDENGYTESIETEVLPESDNPDYDGPVTPLE